MLRTFAESGRDAETGPWHRLSGTSDVVGHGLRLYTTSGGQAEAKNRLVSAANPHVRDVLLLTRGSLFLTSLMIFTESSSSSMSSGSGGSSGS